MPQILRNKPFDSIIDFLRTFCITKGLCNKNPQIIKANRAISIDRVLNNATQFGAPGSAESSLEIFPGTQVTKLHR